MDKRVYERVQEIALAHGLEISEEEDTIFLQSDGELIAIRRCKSDSDKLNIGYQTLDSRIADITLKDSPEPIRHWYNELTTPLEQRDWYKKLSNPKILNDHVPIPQFSSTFDLETALGVCSYIAAKIEANEFRVRAN